MTTEAVLINHNWRLGDGEYLESRSPADEAVVWAGKAAGETQVNEAVSSAKSAFLEWSIQDQSVRSEILLNYAKELEARKQEIAHAISHDMGKPLWESLTEVGAMIGKVKISIQAQEERAGDRVQELAFGHATLEHRPHGVFAVLGPFNFPGHLPNGHIVPALLAGNTCVFKPSEQAPSIVYLMTEAFQAAGLPAGCLNVVQGARETGRALLNANIDGVLFTGSANTGIAIHKHFAGRPEVMLALEMGGNNPLIVDEISDVQSAVDCVLHSAFISAGQRCTCARRLIIVEGDRPDTLIEALVDTIKDIQIGLPDEDVFIGPVVSKLAAQNIFKFESELQKMGGESLVAVQQSERCEALLRPGLIDVTGVEGLPDEEVFGPLLQIIRVKSKEEAVKQANATRFGLSAGVISENDSKWAYYKNRIRAGILNWNSPTTGASSAAPFGGPGLSGNHRPSAYYAADYCAWPQAGMTSVKLEPLKAIGYPSS